MDTDTCVIIRGRINRIGDPMFGQMTVSPDISDMPVESRNIVKRCPLADISATCERWLSLGRSITGIHTYF